MLLSYIYWLASQNWLPFLFSHPMIYWLVEGLWICFQHWFVFFSLLLYEGIIFFKIFYHLYGRLHKIEQLLLLIPNQCSIQKGRNCCCAFLHLKNVGKFQRLIVMGKKRLIWQNATKHNLISHIILLARIFHVFQCLT